METPDNCVKCGAESDEESVILWDARSYCRACVEAESPELYQMAVRGEPLEEGVDHEQASLSRIFLFVATVVFLGVTIVFVVGSVLILISSGDDQFNFVQFVAALLGLAILSFFFICAGCFCVWIGRLFHRGRLPRRIAIQNGEIIYSSRWGEDVRAPLSKCYWNV